jgi:hypothetical protein
LNNIFKNPSKKIKGENREMNLKSTKALSIIVFGLFLTASMYLYWNNLSNKQDEAASIALSFVKSSRTYIYDGLPETLQVKEVELVKRPWTWAVSIVFSSRHAGYGFNTGLMSPHIPHEIRVVVHKGEVVEAILDDIWDELEQRVNRDDLKTR